MRTAECVTPMHPDKICDRISDAILDACLEQDPKSRVAIETMGGHNSIDITGELTTNAYVDMHKVARSIVGDKYGIKVNVISQSSEISQGVDIGGAGDQGIMNGYACRDNPAMIPQPLYLARSLCKFIYAEYPYDGKTQITLNDDNKIAVVIASFQNVQKEKLLFKIGEWISNQYKETEVIEGVVIHANPAGDWNIGGFDADTGVTGRKLMVDNYGPDIPIGGGCFSGKDATKVDRSAAYKARQLAVRYLTQNPEASECFVKLAYAIGVVNPVMATVELNINGQIKKTSLNLDIKELEPLEIIKDLDLRKPQFEKTAQWGHFGNNFLWDRVDEKYVNDMRKM